MTLRLVFMGSPAFSVPTLRAVVDAGHDVCAVYCQPPRRSGRGMAETKGPVHIAAEALGLPVLTPVSLKAAAEQSVFKAHKADAAVVVAYGLLLPQAILDGTRAGCYNVHPSALPRWRGAAPLQRAVMAGDKTTACIVMRMEAGLDTGPMCLREEIAIGPDMTAGALHDALAPVGAHLMVEALRRLEAGTLVETPQPEVGVMYATKIDKAEARLDFSWDAARVHNTIRGLSPFPGAWCEVGSGERRERIKVLASQIVEASGAPGVVLSGDLVIACGTGAVGLTLVQRAGKKPQTAVEFLRGFALASGGRIGDPPVAH